MNENTTLPLPAEGGCQCGEIRYRLTGAPVWLAVCHCSECKRQSGGTFGMSLRMHAADVTLVSGTLKCWTRTADSGVTVNCFFCGNCGNRVWHEPAGSGFLHLKPGTLDDPSRLAPRYEGYTRRRAPWLTVDGIEMSLQEGPSKQN